MLARFAFVLSAATITAPAIASDPVFLHAAGSVRGALTEVAGAFETASGQRVQAKYGPSGTLKDEIVDGARAEVFASANMEHPHALATAGKCGPVVLFARNRLCALVRPGLSLAPATLLERMLDPGVKIGLWWLGKLLYPHLFPKDLQELTREFYPRYYHVTPDVAQIDRVLAGRG